MKRVLFICLGNICRSPLAEGVFLHKAQQQGVDGMFQVDSCGLGDWHVGGPPDPRMQKTAASHGVMLPSRARQITAADFDGFDHLICMDQRNLTGLQELGAPADKVRLLLSYAPHLGVTEVPDPYYGGEDGFEEVFRLVEVACDALLADLQS